MSHHDTLDIFRKVIAKLNETWRGNKTEIEYFRSGSDLQSSQIPVRNVFSSLGWVIDCESRLLAGWRLHWFPGIHFEGIHHHQVCVNLECWCKQGDNRHQSHVIYHPAGSMKFPQPWDDHLSSLNTTSHCTGLRTKWSIYIWQKYFATKTFA